MGKRFLSILSLFSSLGTLVCCALPALFVTLGLGATFAGLISAFPQLIWISKHKPFVFGTGAALLIIAGVFQWRSRSLACPTDPELAKACRTSRDWSRWIYVCSVILYSIGAWFATR